VDAMNARMPLTEPIRDGVLLARAWRNLAAIDRLLRRDGFETLLKRIESSGPACVEVVTGSDLRRARRYARRLNEAARLHYVNARCLHRSLALHQWLRLEGIPSQLRIGVRTADGELFAHAWVEIAGQPIGDEPAALTRFVPLGQRTAEQSSVSD